MNERTVKLSKKGRKEVDENHSIYTKKYLKNKPINDLEKDEYLKLVQAEENGLITMTMHPDKKGEDSERTFAGEIVARKFFHKDEFSKNVKEWNALRADALKLCMEKMLYPLFIKEMKLKLLQEARDYVIKECCLRLYNCLKTGPYAPEEAHTGDEEDDLNDLRWGVRVLGLGYSSERDQASFAAIIDGEGEMIDYIRLVHFTKSRKAFREDERRLKEQDLDCLKKFIVRRKPHVIALAAENLNALYLKLDLEACIRELEESGQVSRRIAIEIVDNELGTVYMNSKEPKFVLCCV